MARTEQAAALGKREVWWTTSLRPRKSFRALDDLADPLFRGRVFPCSRRRTLVTTCKSEYSKKSQEITDYCKEAMTVLLYRPVFLQEAGESITYAIVGFRRIWTEFFPFLGYYTEQDSSKPTFRNDLSVPSSKAKLRGEFTPCDNPREWRIRIHDKIRSVFGK